MGDAIKEESIMSGNIIFNSEEGIEARVQSVIDEAVNNTPFKFIRGYATRDLVYLALLGAAHKAGYETRLGRALREKREKMMKEHGEPPFYTSGFGGDSKVKPPCYKAVNGF